MSERNSITIVSGLPRSGTSLMMQMLQAGGLPVLTDNTRAADDDNPKGYHELEAVKQTRHDASWLEGAVGTVVKMVHLLLHDLPGDHQYDVVFMKRDLAEVVASQQVMLQRAGKAGAQMPREKLIAVYTSQYRKIEAWLAEQPNFRTLYCDYNQLIRDAQPVIEAVNQFLGGAMDAQAMQRVVDPSLYRQRA